MMARMMAGKGGKGMMNGGKGGKGGKGMMMDPMMDPLLTVGPPPRFDSIMMHLEHAGRLADFVDQVEHKCEHQSLNKLAQHEKEITAGIQELLEKVKNGQLFGEDKQVRQRAGEIQANGLPESAHGKLKKELTQAAGKEDDAKIVQVAGSIAEHKIQSTLTKGLDQQKQVEPIDEHPELHTPVEGLRDASLKALDGTLTKALVLYHKRHAHKKPLSLGEHTKISNALRQI